MFLTLTSAIPVFQFDLHDEFLIRNIKIVFISPGAPKDKNKNYDTRPNALKIEVRRAQGQGQGQHDSGGQEGWTAWRYYSSDCARYFSGVTEQGIPSESATSVICVKKYYAGDTVTQIYHGYGLQEVS